MRTTLIILALEGMRPSGAHKFSTAKGKIMPMWSFPFLLTTTSLKLFFRTIPRAASILSCFQVRPEYVGSKSGSYNRSPLKAGFVLRSRGCTMNHTADLDAARPKARKDKDGQGYRIAAC
jgi:hypothetical protein